MNVPGFTAEAALAPAWRSYQMAGFFDADGGLVRPQLCNLQCLDDCISDCFDLPPKFRANCVRFCRRECCH